ncbi:acetyltransferase [Tropicibacter sp. Alg240-R139]|uniref:acetyltransferase n=1 Tax=Tropicibacter sp. Alg240-R139 TaxID=2305991 RepID=UPI0013DED236|nr:acetyltransferase [Tropicibacter sp. Alg240-R139]
MSAENTPPLCLFGAGGHGRVVGAIAARIWPADVVFGDGSRPLGSLVDGIPVGVSDLSDLGEHHVIVTVGNTAARRKLQTRAEELGLSCTYLIADPVGYFAQAPGAGSMILTAAVVNPGARIGRGVIVNTAAVVEHDCVIGDFCHLAPNSVVLGDCTLGDDVWLGANATVVQGVSICSNVTIGAGAVVTRDITEPGTYVGAPARKINDTSALTPSP